jgi:GPH family glycoside/pentoside/hexuronide:cation symporter
LTHGVRREGIISTTLGFMNRLSGLFTSFAFFLVYQIYSYESGEAPGDRPGDASRFLMVVFPFAAMVLSVAASRFLKFPERDAIEPKSH